MLLSKLLEDVSVFSEYEDIEIDNVTSNSKEVKKGSLFICIKGTKADGHNFVEKALNNGATAIIAEHDVKDHNLILVSDSKKAYAIICRNLYKNKSKELKMIAVTGTNGKTSVATIIKMLLCKTGIECGLISTIKTEYLDKSIDSEQTTPDAYELNLLLDNMYQSGVKVISMEASSHALDQDRLYGIEFDVAVFTNLTQDHLDYHKSMEEYFKAKKKLFSNCKYAVLNVDDDYGKRIAEDINCPFCSVSVKDKNADFFAESIVCDSDGVSFLLCHKEVKSRIRFKIPGTYSVYNALEAIAVLNKFGFSISTIAQKLSEIESIKGRNEIIKTQRGFNIVCDYAHTPDGLLNIINSTRSYTKGRIILLFGCGGDRDKEKRPIMGEIASKYADYVIITSDNPRTEKPHKIINEIIKGIKKDNYIAIPDRKLAVRYALEIAKSGDTVILAGKGHEVYQVLGDKKVYFDERKLVSKTLKILK